MRTAIAAVALLLSACNRGDAPAEQAPAHPLSANLTDKGSIANDGNGCEKMARAIECHRLAVVYRRATRVTGARLYAIDPDESIRVGNGQGFNEQSSDSAEYDAVCADGESNGDDRRDGEPWRTGEAPKRNSNRLHHRQCSEKIFSVFDTAAKRRRRHLMWLRLSSAWYCLSRRWCRECR